jgi:histidinol-phosphate aminotransferase
MKFMEIELENLGVKFINSSTNFILINLSDKDKLSAQNAVLFFKKNGVLVREMNVYNLPNYIRVSLGTEEENKYFLKLLKKFIMKNDN